MVEKAQSYKDYYDRLMKGGSEWNFRVKIINKNSIKISNFVTGSYREIIS